MDCNYHVYAPRSDEGQFAWGVFKIEAWRVKVAGLGVVIGVELDAARRKCAAAGIDASIAEDLLAACERGMVAAMNEKEDGDAGQD